MRGHFLPIFLSKRWTNPSGELGKFVQTDYGLKFSSKATPGSIGFKKNLTALEDVTRPHVIEEGLLKQVDTDAADVLRKIEAGIQLTREERSIWTAFLLSLRMRQPWAVEKVRNEAPDTLKEQLNLEPAEYDVLRKEEGPRTLAEWVDINEPQIYKNLGMKMLPNLITNPPQAEKLFQMRWWTQPFLKPIPDLMIGDEPLLMWGGMDHPKCLIVLPLNPRLAFIATPNEAIRANIHHTDPKMLAAQINEATVLGAHKRVFATGEQHRRFIENRMKRFPDVLNKPEDLPTQAPAKKVS
jgi:hypothetical protein